MDEDILNLLSKTIEITETVKCKPVKHVSSYNMFLSEFILKNSNESKQKFGESSKQASELWKQLTPQEKEKYKEKSICKNEFAEKRRFSNDKKSQYKCSKCGKGVYYLKNLSLHEKECGMEFNCDKCKKIFYTSSNLKYHMQHVHENNKKFVCDICKRGFDLLKDLERHEVVHTKAKPFKCSICNQSFSFKCNLTRHERKQHA